MNDDPFSQRLRETLVLYQNCQRDHDDFECHLRALRCNNPQLVTEVLANLRWATKKFEGDKNRVLSQLWGSVSTRKLEPEAIKTIWSWANDKTSFFLPGGRKTGEQESPVLPGEGPFFNSVCSLLKQMRLRNQVDTVRTRLLLYFLARFVDERCEGAQEIEVVSLLVSKGWISKVLQPFLEVHFHKWLAAGRVYVRLVELLGVGEGILIFLPLLGPSTWEQKCSLGTEQGDLIVSSLCTMGVPAEASVIRDDKRSGHAVVEEMMQHFFDQSPSNFVICDPSHGSAASQGGRRVRRPRSRLAKPRRTGRVPRSPHNPASHHRRPDNASSGSEFSWLADGVYSPSPAGTETPETASAQSEYCRVLPVDPRLEGTPPQAVV